MKTKLTLTVDRNLIARAKVAARAQRTSISSLVETFLSNLSLEEQKSFSDKWLGAFKEPPHQRPNALRTMTPSRHLAHPCASHSGGTALHN